MAYALIAEGIIKAIEGGIELALFLVDLAQKMGVSVDPKQIIADAAKRVKDRSKDLTTVQTDVLDILDGTKPLVEVTS